MFYRISALVILGAILLFAVAVYSADHQRRSRLRAMQATDNRENVWYNLTPEQRKAIEDYHQGR